MGNVAGSEQGRLFSRNKITSERNLMEPFLALITPLAGGQAPGVPTPPIYYPPEIWPKPGYPAHPIAPGGGPAHPIVIPPDAIAPGVPEHPIVLPPPEPGHPIIIPPDAIAPGVPSHPIYLPPSIWPDPGVPAHPIAPGGPPPGIWPGPGAPAHPIVIPPDAIAPGVPAHPIVLPPVAPAHPIVIPPGWEPPKSFTVVVRDNQTGEWKALTFVPGDAPPATPGAGPK
jgi:hypothetical protein